MYGWDKFFIFLFFKFFKFFLNLFTNYIIQISFHFNGTLYILPVFKAVPKP